MTGHVGNPNLGLSDPSPTESYIEVHFNNDKLLNVWLEGWIRINPHKWDPARHMSKIFAPCLEGISSDSHPVHEKQSGTSVVQACGPASSFSMMKGFRKELFNPIELLAGKGKFKYKAILPDLIHHHVISSLMGVETSHVVMTMQTSSVSGH